VEAFFLEQREILLITHGNVDEAVEVFFIDFIYEHKQFEYTRSLWKLFFWSKSTRSFLPHTLYMPMKLLRFINRTQTLNTDGVQEQHMTHPCTTIVSRISISFQCPGNRCKPEKVLKATFPSTSCKHQQDRVIHKDQILNPLPV
jgi:hypothetical protein